MLDAVFVDVQIDLGRFVRIRGGYRRRTAQIDVLVVGPSGVSVLEVKRWSRRFAAEGDGHDPFDQVRAASTLCYLYLKDRLRRPVKTRDVIVTDGALPPRPAGSHVIVVRPNAIGVQVLRGSGSLAPDEVASAIGVLQNIAREFPPSAASTGAPVRA